MLENPGSDWSFPTEAGKIRPAKHHKNRIDIRTRGDEHVEAFWNFAAVAFVGGLRIQPGV